MNQSLQALTLNVINNAGSIGNIAAMYKAVPY
jgi:hypothetical protein